MWITPNQRALIDHNSYINTQWGLFIFEVNAFHSLKASVVLLHMPAPHIPRYRLCLKLFTLSSTISTHNSTSTSYSQPFGFQLALCFTALLWATDSQPYMVSVFEISTQQCKTLVNKKKKEKLMRSKHNCFHFQALMITCCKYCALHISRSLLKCIILRNEWRTTWKFKIAFSLQHEGNLQGNWISSKKCNLWSNGENWISVLVTPQQQVPR